LKLPPNLLNNQGFKLPKEIGKNLYYKKPKKKEKKKKKISKKLKKNVKKKKQTKKNKP